MFNFGEAQIAPRKTESGDISFSRSIVGLRQDRGITLQECARLTGVSASTWSKIERGELSPTVTTLQKIAVGLGIEMGDLLASTRSGAGAAGRQPKQPRQGPCVEDLQEHAAMPRVEGQAHGPRPVHGHRAQQ